MTQIVFAMTHKMNCVQKNHVKNRDEKKPVSNNWCQSAKRHSFSPSLHISINSNSFRVNKKMGSGLNLSMNWCKSDDETSGWATLVWFFSSSFRVLRCLSGISFQTWFAIWFWLDFIFPPVNLDDKIVCTIQMNKLWNILWKKKKKKKKLTVIDS